MRNATTIDPISRILRRTFYDHGCWTWTGAIMTNGYGVIGRSERNKGSRLVHRIMFESENGPIAGKLQIDHLCRNRACCNPLHLDLVTNRENTMRGACPAVCAEIQRRKTHCKRGHEFSGKNLRIRKRDGARLCVACCRAQSRAWASAHRGQA